MILGEDELARSTASLKNMGSGEQVEVRLSAEEIMQMVQRGE
jgi:histidyl-tRNA synthetase